MVRGCPHADGHSEDEMAKRYSVRGLARSYSNYQEDIIVVKTAVIGLGYIGLPQPSHSLLTVCRLSV